MHDAVVMTTWPLSSTGYTQYVAWRLICMEFVDPTVKISLSYQVTLTVVIVVVANCIQA